MLDGSLFVRLHCYLNTCVVVFGLVVYDVVRCVKITYDGLLHVLHKCSTLQTLNLYALSGYYKKHISFFFFYSGCIETLAVVSSGTDLAIFVDSQTKPTRKYHFWLI